MVVRGVTLYLLLGYLIKAGATSTCANNVCLRCNTTATGADPCELCNATQCISGFQVSISSNDSKLVEGDDLILTCVHNLPDVNHTFGWKMNGVTIQDQNESELHDKKVLSNKAGTYICFVESLCGNYQSLPYVVAVESFQVSISSNDFKLVEGDDLILTCVHNLPDVNHTFGWKMNGVTIQDQNESELHDKKVLSNKAGTYICFVESLCGNYQSLPHVVAVENNSLLLLVVCGVSALVLVLVMGLVMKFKLKRDNAKHRERMRQKATVEQRAAPFTPRES
ncbi:hypothetical protein KUCAC02_004820 [Chaenocephalus aceratus]|uniref:Uncharacterized protein n=1 Tax=Chaenocephalus aceratus TaxID=36190 RepID=A0ACB9X1D2_CHAAC|nr:hypothetical protein KUCAC02_004820 [Chaenocephalus aceratus]